MAEIAPPPNSHPSKYSVCKFSQDLVRTNILCRDCVGASKCLSVRSGQSEMYKVVKPEQFSAIASKTSSPILVHPDKSSASMRGHVRSSLDNPLAVTRFEPGIRRARNADIPVSPLKRTRSAFRTPTPEKSSSCQCPLRPVAILIAI